MAQFFFVYTGGIFNGRLNLGFVRNFGKAVEPQVVCLVFDSRMNYLSQSLQLIILGSHALHTVLGT